MTATRAGQTTETAQSVARWVTVLLATASAIVSSNIYCNQPLLGTAAAALGVPPGVLGLVPTAVQFGCAAGILVWVPAGDLLSRRRLILALTSVSALALVAAGLAQNVPWLVAASFAIGALSPIPQLVVPLAVALDGGVRRGRVVGTIQAGLLVGVLVSRTGSGWLAEWAGWHTVYWVSCVLTIALAVVLWRALPADPAPKGAPGGYRAVMASLPRLLARPLVWRITVSGALVGISLGAFWTTLTFLLEQDYGLGAGVVGLFGLVSAVTAVASPASGRLADRVGHRRALAALVGLVLAGWLVLWPGGQVLPWLLVGVVLLDVGMWGSQVICQAALFTLERATHNRLNALYFVLRFSGIAAGSSIGSLAWSTGGWTAVVLTGLLTGVAALVIGVSARTGAAPSGTQLAVAAGRD
ncbi:MFS transporter [Kutzneria viridogrisea]|uniref:MFS family arabinose efflux permease n=1 Tax=Kutzneria viridogrisea TaxID=47990 RepID=A0ABR6BUX7_9PSEU|nr:putative MFS family arabinose efflux permease [Kutzneria viridogrisea]